MKWRSLVFFVSYEDEQRLGEELRKALPELFSILEGVQERAGGGPMGDAKGMVEKLIKDTSGGVQEGGE